MPDPSNGVTYSALIADALTRYRDRDAFIVGDRHVTYDEATAITGSFVDALRVRGVGIGSGVVALSPNSPESWLVQAATYLLGGRFSGLQLLGSVDDHVFICNDAEASVLIVAEGYADQADRIRASVPSIKHLLILRTEGGCDAFDESVRPSELTAGPAGDEEVAWLQYTGGTTGRPKGVMLPQRAMVQQTLSLMASWGLPEEPRYLAASPITHAAVLPVLPTLLRGGTVILLPAFTPDGWLSAVQEHKVNYAFAVPTMIYALLDSTVSGEYDVSSLHTIVYGASPMSPARLVEAQQRFGNIFQQVYGQTENAATATTLRRDEHDPSRPELLASCGRAVVGAQVAVLDENGKEVPASEIGELCVRSHAVMLGYRNLAEETAEVLRDGWLRSGDMARRDDAGFFYIVDRKKDMIISGGFNIYAREVEDALTSHPSVAAAAVIGVPDEKWGEAVKAIVVTRTGEEPDPAELTAYVKEHKSALHAPKSIDFVESLPMTPVGKVDKKALRAPYWAGEQRQVH